MSSHSPRDSVPARSQIHVGSWVLAVEKKNYHSGELTKGRVKMILTNKAYHPRGIKVMFEDGTVARVQELAGQNDFKSEGLRSPTDSVTKDAEASLDEQFDPELELR